MIHSSQPFRLPWGLRRAIEFTASVGVALLFSYLILEARW